MKNIELFSKQVDKNNELTAFFFLLFVFIVSSAFFAMNLKPGIVPDESEHFAVSKQYSTTWGVPEDTQETNIYGPLAHKPYLYYWINGRVLDLLKLIIIPMNDWNKLVSLRFLSIIYSLFSILFAYRLAKEVIQKPWWPLLVVFLLTNTLMFIFLSGGVNYDNLINLCSFAGIYFLVRVFNGGHFYKNSFGWLIFILGGTLTKLTIFPLVIVMGIVWVIYVIWKRKKIDFQNYSVKGITLLLIIFIVLMSLNLALYGVNLLKYRALIPSCTQIFTQSQCDQTVSVTDYEGVYLPEKLTLSDILRGYPDPIEWFFDFWIGRMMVMIYGIFGHKHYFPELIISLYRLLALWLLIIAVRYGKKTSFVQGSLYSIFAFYLLILLLVNYRGELATGFKHVAIQGRYIFPVIGILYSFVVYFIIQVPKTDLRKSTTSFIIFLFLLGNWMSPLLELVIPPLSVALPEKSVPPDQPIAELVEGVEVSQDFVSECEGTINQIDIMLSVDQPSNIDSVIFRLSDLSNNQVIVDQIIPGNSIKDKIWHRISIQPLANSFDKSYLITIALPNDSTVDGVTIIGSRVDKYPGGKAVLNDLTEIGDIGFRYHCRQPVFREWFI